MEIKEIKYDKNTGALMLGHGIAELHLASIIPGGPGSPKQLINTEKIVLPTQADANAFINTFTSKRMGNERYVIDKASDEVYLLKREILKLKGTSGHSKNTLERNQDAAKKELDKCQARNRSLLANVEKLARELSSATELVKSGGQTMLEATEDIKTLKGELKFLEEKYNHLLKFGVELEDYSNLPPDDIRVAWEREEDITTLSAMATDTLNLGYIKAHDGILEKITRFHESSHKPS